MEGRRVDFGIGKTGTAHQLAWHLKEGSRYALDIVVVAFLSANDFGDNLNGPYDLQEGELIHNPIAYSSLRTIQKTVYAVPGYRWLAEHSHVVNLARTVATSFYDGRRRDTAETSLIDNHTAQYDYSVELTAALIEEFASETQEEGSRFLMLSFPARGQKLLAMYESNEEIKPYVFMLADLQTELENRGIELLDFVPIFTEWPATTTYYEFDGHWRPAGHEVVVPELFRQLEEWVDALIEERSASRE